MLSTLSSSILFFVFFFHIFTVEPRNVGVNMQNYIADNGPVHNHAMQDRKTGPALSVAIY